MNGCWKEFHSHKYIYFHSSRKFSGAFYDHHHWVCLWWWGVIYLCQWKLRQNWFNTYLVLPFQYVTLPLRSIHFYLKPHRRFQTFFWQKTDWKARDAPQVSQDEIRRTNFNFRKTRTRQDSVLSCLALPCGNSGNFLYLILFDENTSTDLSLFWLSRFSDSQARSLGTSRNRFRL